MSPNGDFPFDPASMPPLVITPPDPDRLASLLAADPGRIRAALRDAGLPVDEDTP